MPQKQPPARTAVCWPLVGARGASTEGFGIATAPPAALQEAPRPSGRTAARIAKARTMNRSMTTLLSRWLGPLLSVRYHFAMTKADRQPLAGARDKECLSYQPPGNNATHYTPGGLLVCGARVGLMP